MREIEKPRRRHVIDANDIGAEFPDPLKVACGLILRGEEALVSAGCEGSVGHALDVEFLLVQAETLSIHAHAGRTGVRYHRIKSAARRAFVMRRLITNKSVISK
jgi:hypothetical protein